jgi:hypothetical protein
MSGVFESSDIGELYATVEFGLDMDQFIKSPIGQYLLRKAGEERIDALADLVEVSPADSERIRALQSIIKRADSLLFWINDAIQAGKNAEMQLDPRETVND